jgi:hypothetical protein
MNDRQMNKLCGALDRAVARASELLQDYETAGKFGRATIAIKLMSLKSEIHALESKIQHGGGTIGSYSSNVEGWLRS